MTSADLKHDPYAALRIRDFRLYIFGRLSNTIAFLIVEVVIGWEVFALTKDPLSLGLIGLAEAIPAISVSLYAGHLSDSKSRKKISLIAQGVLLICIFTLLLISSNLEFIYRSYGTTPIYAVIFVMGLSSGFLAPSIIAFSYQLIPSELAANASAWRSSAWQIGAIVGPAVGGLLFGYFGPFAAYSTALVLASFGTLCIFLIPEQAPTIKSRKETVSESLKKGIQFVFRNQIIVGALSLDLFAVLFGGAVALLPVYASEILKIGPEGLGILRASPAIGAAITALWMAHTPMKGAIGKKLFLAIIGFGLTIIVFGISLNPVLSVCILALGGAFDSVSVVIRSTLLQLSTPNEMRGRVEAVNMMFIGSSNEISAFESGVAAKVLGVVPSVVFGGIMTLLSVGATWRIAPVLRNLKYDELLSRAQITNRTE
ncbi:MAG: MFS transporter [Ignavibacteriota bacterium]